MYLVPRRWVIRYRHTGPNGNKLARRQVVWATSQSAARRRAVADRPSGFVIDSIVRLKNVTPEARRSLSSAKIQVGGGLSCLLFAFTITMAYTPPLPTPREVPFERYHPHPQAEDDGGWNCHFDGNQECEARVKAPHF